MHPIWDSKLFHELCRIILMKIADLYSYLFYQTYYGNDTTAVISNEINTFFVFPITMKTL